MIKTREIACFLEGVLENSGAEVSRGKEDNTHNWVLTIRTPHGTLGSLTVWEDGTISAYIEKPGGGAFAGEIEVRKWE